VCCDTACTATCMACSAALTQSGTSGVCSPVKYETAPPRGSCSSSPPCGGDGKCSGAGACNLNAPAGTSCGASSCDVTNTIVTGQACDGMGACKTSQGVNCDPFKCVSGSCTTSCTVDGDCASDGYCKNGVCAKRQANGAS